MWQRQHWRQLAAGIGSFGSRAWRCAVGYLHMARGRTSVPTRAWMWACFLRKWMLSRIAKTFLTSDSLSWRNTALLIGYKAQITTREKPASSKMWSSSFQKGKRIKRAEAMQTEYFYETCINTACLVKTIKTMEEHLCTSCRGDLGLVLIFLSGTYEIVFVFMWESNLILKSTILICHCQVRRRSALDGYRLFIY